MLSGMDRHIQITRCFRDEDLRADRQPEFTQIDMELAFVDVDDVIDVNERLLAHLFKEVLGVEVQLPIQRMTWKEAMNRFGSDKPDLRFGMELVDVSETVKDTELRAHLKTAVLSAVLTQRDRAQCRERKSTSSLSLRKVTVQKVLHTLQSMRMEAGNLPSPNL